MTPTNPDSPDNLANNGSQDYNSLLASDNTIDSELDELIDNFYEDAYSHGWRQARRKDRERVKKEAKAALLKWAAQEANKAVINEFKKLDEFHDASILRSVIRGRIAQLTEENRSSDE